MMGLTDRPAGRSLSTGFPKKPASGGGRPQPAAEHRTQGAFGHRKTADAKIRAAEDERLARRAAMFPAKNKPDQATDGESGPSRPFQAAAAERPRRPAKSAPFKSAKSSSFKPAKKAPAKRKGPGRSDKPTESFGRRSPGQPKRPKGKSPRGR